MNKFSEAVQSSSKPRLSWPATAGGLGVIVAAATVCAVLLQYSVRGTGVTLSQVIQETGALDILVIAVLMLFVWSVLGRIWWSVGLVAALLALVSTANRNKVELRREPVFPSDLDFIGEAGFLFSMVGAGAVFGVVVGLLALVAVILLVGRITGRWFPRPRLRHPDGRWNRRFLLARLGVLTVTGGLLLHAASFNGSPNLWRTMYDSAGAKWATSSQLHNYRANGFMAGFLYNMPVDPMARPEGYDAQAMAELSERYQQRAGEINEFRDGSLEDVNVVMVLSESFTDPSQMEGFELETDPIPETRQIMSESISGQLYANSYGGGTSTMEFESLTGQPVGLFQPQVTSPYQMFVSDYRSYPSAVGAFSALGHHTVAIHAYNLHMYKRTEVYKTFGFDEVIDDAAMQSRQRVERNPYVSDQAAFDEVLHHVDTNGAPVFTNLVTMQNHGPYGDFYDDPIASDIADPGSAGEIGQYTRGLAHSDAAVSEFLRELQAKDEETVVVFYGDHHPGVYSQEILNANEPEAQLRTPYFVWSSKTGEVQKGGGALTPAMLLPAIYEAADAPVPPYVALLEDVRNTVPVLQHSRTLDPEGRPLDRENLDDHAQGLVDDLTMVQYDFSIGSRYAVDTMWPGAAEGVLPDS